MPLVAGVDSSTQSCKVVIRDAETGKLVREGRAPHPRRHRGAAGRVGGGAVRRGRTRPAVWTTWRPPRSPGSSTAWCAWTTTGPWSAGACCGTTPARPAPPST